MSRIDCYESEKKSKNLGREREKNPTPKLRTLENSLPKFGKRNKRPAIITRNGRERERNWKERATRWVCDIILIHIMIYDVVN